MSGVQSLAQLVGIDTAKLLTMTGETVSGERAHQLGLVTSVATDPVEAAEELVARLVERSPDAVAATKRLFESTWESPARRTFARERAEQLALLLSANTRAARQAAVRRETPVFAARKR